MKKGISLIVLVITIIVMIIIAGAIILALNSSNVTGKASWAQISADRANLQSEYATILADVVARQKVGTDYVGIKITDVLGYGADEVEGPVGGVTDDDAEVKAIFDAWKTKVKSTNDRFDIVVPGDTDGDLVMDAGETWTNENPAAIKIEMELEIEEANAFGLVLETKEVGDKEATTGKVVGYDWVKVDEDVDPKTGKLVSEEENN